MLPPHAPNLQRAGIVCFGAVIRAVLRLFTPRIFQNARRWSKSLAHPRRPGRNNQGEGYALPFFSAHIRSRAIFKPGLNNRAFEHSLEK